MQQLIEFPPRQRRLELLHRMQDRYIPTRRDEILADAVSLWIDTTLSSLAGEHPEGRILGVIGESGAGKTWAIEHAIKAEPRIAETILCITAPRPCTLKQLGRVILAELGYPLERDLLEHLTWQKVRDLLEANQIRFIWMDEMQHVFDGKSDRDLTAISDTIKNLVQRRRWPVGFLLSGLPALSGFLGRDRQVERRSRSVEFGPMSFPTHTGMIRKSILRVIVEQHAGLRLDVSDDEFVHRLCHATAGAFGVMTDLTRAAVLSAATRMDFDGGVGVDDFAAAYAAERGCERSQNIFIATNWHEIRPENSRRRDAGFAGAVSC